MRVPAWLTFLVAGVVILFGIYRLRIFMYGVERYQQLAERSPMYRIPRRNHLLMGVVFVVLGGWLIATALGYGPFGGR